MNPQEHGAHMEEVKGKLLQIKSLIDELLSAETQEQKSEGVEGEEDKGFKGYVKQASEGGI
jgi:hypothetical protein